MEMRAPCGALVALTLTESGCIDACVGAREDQERLPTGVGQVLSSGSLWGGASYRTPPGSANSAGKRQASIVVSEMDSASGASL